MLTPEYLDSIPDEVVKLYAEFETEVIVDIARRINNLQYGTAAFQLEQLQQSQLVLNNTLSRISRLTGISEKEIKDTLESASARSLRIDDSIHKANGKEVIPFNKSPLMLQLLEANVLKTSNNLLNLTRTTAFSSQQLFIQASNLAQLQVQSGAFTADQAITHAIKKASRDGLQVRYPSGAKRSIEAAVRTNVLTGVNQTAAKLQELRMDQLNVDLVEVTAHAGARDKGTGPKNHMSWQGGVYSRSGQSDKYDDFVATTGYGTVTGLGGANCKHNFFPFYPGSGRVYDKELLKEYKKNDVTYNGKEMSYYEATQKQRYMERHVRKWKTEAKALEAAGKDSSLAKSKVRTWQKKTRELVKQTGVRRDYTRERIA